MAKPEWGIKRTCQDCEAVFYDMKNTPITCPKCKAIYDEGSLLKKHSLDPSQPINHLDELLPQKHFEVSETYLVDTSAELLESLEDLEEEYEPTQLLRR